MPLRPVQVFASPTAVTPNVPHTYWVDDDGTVYDHPVDGVAWKNRATRAKGEAVWTYARRGGQELYLRPVAQPLGVPAEYPYPTPKPTQGLRPDFVAVAEYDKARCKEIGEAILRYATAMQPIPQHWLDELAELTERNQPEDII